MKNKEQKQQCIAVRSGDVFSRFEETTDDFAQAISEKMAEGYILQGAPELINGQLVVFMVYASVIIHHLAQDTVGIQRPLMDIPEEDDEGGLPDPKPARPEVRNTDDKLPAGSYSPLSDKPEPEKPDPIEEFKEELKEELKDSEETPNAEDPAQPVDAGGDLNSLLGEEETESHVYGSPSATDKQEEVLDESRDEVVQEDAGDEEANDGELVKTTEPADVAVTEKEENQEARNNEVDGGTTENN